MPSSAPINKESELEKQELEKQEPDNQEPDNQERDKQEQAQQTPLTAETVAKAKLPKRLIALLLFLTLASVSGIMANQGVLFCILTLFIVLAVLGRQLVGLYLLRGYTLVQLVAVCFLPVILYQPDNPLVGPSTFHLGTWQGKVPDLLVFGLLIIIAMVQAWIAFSPKVKAYCHVRNSMNIMR